MPLTAANFVANTGVVRAQDMLNFFNLFTGVMNDQPVHFANALTVDNAVVAGNTGTPLTLGVASSGAYIAAAVGGNLQLAAGGTPRWRINFSTGNLEASTDNTTDIGTAGGNRPRDLWLGRNLSAGGNGSINGTLQVTGALTQTGAATFGSTVTLSADPALALQAATKQYVDNGLAPKITQAQGDARYLQLAGGTVTGALTVQGSTTLAAASATSLNVSGTSTLGTVTAGAITATSLSMSPVVYTNQYIYKGGAPTATSDFGLYQHGTSNFIRIANDNNIGLYTDAASGNNWGGSNAALMLDTSLNATFAGTIDNGGNSIYTGTVYSRSQIYSTTAGSLYLRGNDGNVHIDSGGQTLYIASSTFSNNCTVAGNLQVNGNINGGVSNAGTISANVFTSGNQFNWTDGSYMIVSGGYIYIRSSGGSQGLVVQNTGGGNVPISCAGINGNGYHIIVDQGNSGYGFQCRDGNVMIWRGSSANYMRIRSYDQRFDFENASGGTGFSLQFSSGQADHMGPNGSTNHRFFHLDGSWMGTQAANFQVQSALKYKEDVRPIEDRSLALICQPELRGVGYSLKHTGDRRLGFVADHWEEFLPEAVGRNRDTGEVETFDYDQVVPILWEVVRLLAQRSGLCR